jgi:hypothetical protein
MSKEQLSQVQYKKFYAPLDPIERELWEQFLIEQVHILEGEQKRDDVTIDSAYEEDWIVYRSQYLQGLRQKRLAKGKEKEDPEIEALAEDFQKKLIPSTSTSTMKMADTQDAYLKALKKLLKEPGDFDGERYKFDDWWETLNLWLTPYERLDDKAKISGTLVRMTKGEAATWAKLKIQDFNEGKLTSWDDFAKELKERFEDKNRIQKAANDLHNFVHTRGSLIRYLDQFEELKTIAKTDDKTALGYLKRGISVKYMRQMFGTPNAVPDTYKELMEQLQALANNMDLAWGFQQSLTKPHV